jgi:catechol-2,3-dioxygenase
VAHLAFNIPENLFAEAVRWAGERADLIEVDGSVEVDFRAWNAHSVYFSDPDGNVLELIARHGLDNAASEMALLEVSEVGLPVPDVGEAAGWLIGVLGLEVYDSVGDTFAALGDERGLFILSREGRNWFPTRIPSARCAIDVMVDGEAARSELPGLPYAVQGSRAA